MLPINEEALFDTLKDEMEKIPTNLFEEVEEELTKLFIHKPLKKWEKKRTVLLMWLPI